MKRFFLSLIALLVLSPLLVGCGPHEKTPLIVFGAGSLIQPFSQLEAAFEAENPDIDVQNEFHGSIQVMRHVTDIHEKIDVVATADVNLIPLLMEGTIDEETGKPYADWYIRFATNRLAISYTENSRHADEINDQNWYEILLRPDVRVGLADPRFDAAGYRSMMVLKMAESYYQRPALLFDLFHGVFRSPIKTTEEDGQAVIHIPEVLETKTGSRIVMRGGSIEMNALLESGDVDYAFEYESVIRQLGFKMIPLPDQLNLGSPDQAETYHKVKVLLDFKRFAKVKPEFTGEQIGYGITIPTNAPHSQAALRYLEFLFSEKGKAIMDANYHPFLDPLEGYGKDSLPSELKDRVSAIP